MFVPSWCKWEIDNPPKFTLWHNILFACAGGVYAANLYYSHPILEVMAESLGTGQTGVVNIPTLAQAGDGLGLLLIMPLADFFPRRTFTITILTLTTLFWLGLCFTHSLPIFQVLTFLSAMFTGVHQVFIVLVAELSEPEKRAFNIGIVGMGPTLSILLARILSGIVANYIAWRWIYWISLAMQVVVLLLLLLFLPNYPTINKLAPVKLAKKYPQILADIVLLLFKHARLVQAGVLAFLTFFCVSSYWTTLTFLLSASPYNYSTLVIGLFGLVGAATMVLGPVFGKYVVQPLGMPLCSAMIGVTTSLVGIVLGTALGSKYVAGPLLQALLLDAGLMLLFISVRTSIHGIAPGKENRVNTAFAICLYLGGLSGTKAGNDVYAISGGTRGWVASGCLSIAIMATSYLVILARGPHETRWIGWRGGWGRYSHRAEDQAVERVESGSDASVIQADLEKGAAAAGLQAVVADVSDATAVAEPPKAKVLFEKQ